jgi:HK97 gp10 family phage protein
MALNPGSIHIEGLSELNDLLLTLPGAIQNKVMRGALRAGQKVIMDTAKGLVPVGVPSMENIRLYGAYMGALRDSIKISTRSSAGKIVCTIRAGNAKAFYASWVEFGTKAHVIRAQHGGKLYFGGRYIDKIDHPGAKRVPFMRQAFDAQYRAGLDAVVSYLGARINKEIGQLPDEVDG